MIDARQRLRLPSGWHHQVSRERFTSDFGTAAASPRTTPDAN